MSGRLKPVPVVEVERIRLAAATDQAMSLLFLHANLDTFPPPPSRDPMPPLLKLAQVELRFSSGYYSRVKKLVNF